MPHSRTRHFVGTGEVKTSIGDCVLTSSGIGSCVVVVVFQPGRALGGMAHVMLPGKCRKAGSPYRTRYAWDAIETVVEQIMDLGGEEGRLEACLVGGANVLNRNDETVGRDNLEAVEDELAARNIPVRARATGGELRRTVVFDISSQSVQCSEGNSKICLLCRTDWTEQKMNDGDPSQSSEELELMRNNHALSRKDMRSFLLNLPDALYSILPDEAGTVIFLSDRWREWTGYLPEDFFSEEGCSAAIHHSDRERVRDIYREACSTGKDFEAEYRIVHLDSGRVRWVRDRCNIITDENDGVLRLDGVISNISDRIELLKKYEGTLQEMGERVKELNCLYSLSESIRTSKTLDEIMQRVVESIPPAWNYPEITEGRITLENSQYSTEGFRKSPWLLASDIEIYGEAVGRIEVCYTEERTEIGEGPFLKEERELLNTIARILSEAIKRRRLETELIEKNRDLSANNQQLRAANQQMQASNQQLRAGEQQLRAANQQLRANEQELIAAYRELEASQDRYRSTVESISDGFMILETPDLIVHYFNSEAENLLGRKKEEVLGKPLFDAFPEARGSEFEARYREAYETGETCVFETYFSQEPYQNWYSVRVYPGEDGISVFFQVITHSKLLEEERLALEAQLTQAQKMESIGRLAGGVAHDFNNILTVILGYSEMALDSVGEDSPIRDDLVEISRAAMKSRDITQQLLAFARKQTIAPEVLDLNEIVDGLLRMLQRLISEDIQLDWKPGEGLWHVKMDPSQIDQMLTNLCVNSRDAISGVGRITIETSNVSLERDDVEENGYSQPGEYVMLSVSDDGRGMNSETLQNIFEPFYTTKNGDSGSGLGLSMVYGIVRQNQGFIKVDSREGEGSTFRIYLPRTAGENSSRRTVDSGKIPQGNGEMILLVEDDIPIMHMSSAMLQGLGYTVISAGTPSRALELLKENSDSIRLMMTDVVMPEMNGRVLAEEVKKTIPDVKVLFMSGYTANVIAHRGVLDQGVNFIQKPFSRQELAKKLSDILL